MSAITSHVLDTARGLPAAGVPIRLERRREGAEGEWRELGRAVTDADGRARTLLPAGAPLEAGLHRLTFDLRTYFGLLGVESFYPEATVVFEVREPGRHHHVPLLVAPYGYSTYRGS